MLFPHQIKNDISFVENELNSGEMYRIDGATFDENVWQLTPRVAKKLNSLVTVLRKHPEMEMEISAHTETLGLADRNLELSKNRETLKSPAPKG